MKRRGRLSLQIPLCRHVGRGMYSLYALGYLTRGSTSEHISTLTDNQPRQVERDSRSTLFEFLDVLLERFVLDNTHVPCHVGRCCCDVNTPLCDNLPDSASSPIPRPSTRPCLRPSLFCSSLWIDDYVPLGHVCTWCGRELNEYAQRAIRNNLSNRG